MFDHTAVEMYSRARGRAQWGRVRSFLSGRSRRLIDLAEASGACSVNVPRYAGMRTVPIDQICGSQGRSNDFDRDFNPLQTHTMDRWLSVAGARRRERAMPPVELIQVGEVYFVQDGHHRISVARALGQLDIEAEVTVWQVTGPLPWERSTAGHSRAGQGAEIGRLLRRARDGSARFQERLLVSIRGLLSAAGIKLRARVLSQAGASNL